LLPPGAIAAIPQQAAFTGSLSIPVPLNGRDLTTPCSEARCVWLVVHATSSGRARVRAVIDALEVQVDKLGRRWSKVEERLPGFRVASQAGIADGWSCLAIRDAAPIRSIGWRYEPRNPHQGFSDPEPRTVVMEKFFAFATSANMMSRDDQR